MTPEPQSTPHGRPQTSPAEWAAIEQADDFRELVAAKRSFIFPATAFFILYYFALPILVGYFPELMSVDVIGEVNLAYLFALSQFVMAWVIMAMYVRRAKGFDQRVERLVGRVKGTGR